MSGDVNNGGWTLAIDFGTTATVAAALDATGRPTVLQIDGQREIPSIVFLDDDGTLLVGQTAADLAIGRPDRAIQTPKERLSSQTPVVIGGQAVDPIELIAAVLRRTLDGAVAYQGSHPTASRLTYPAMWSGPLKSRLLEAARRADLPSPELVTEPVAAALAYSERAHLPVGASIAVFDLGGGTFDTVVLVKRAGGFTIAGRPVGDPSIGGELFDELLMNEVGNRLEPERWEQLLTSDNPAWRRSARRMRNDCKRAKEALSRHPVADVVVSLPDGVAEARITQDEFESIIEPHIEETTDLLGRCLARASLDPTELHAIYLTGGASRIPAVKRSVEAAFPGTPIVQQGDPKAATALGALMAIPTTTDRDVVPGSGRTSADRQLSSATPLSSDAPEKPQAPPSIETALDTPARSTPPLPPSPPQRPKKREASQPRGRIIFLVSGVFAVLFVAFASVNALGSRSNDFDAAVEPVDSAQEEDSQSTSPSAAAQDTVPATSVVPEPTDDPEPTDQVDAEQSSGPDFSPFIDLPEEFEISEVTIDPDLVCDTVPTTSAPDRDESDVGQFGDRLVQVHVGQYGSARLATEAQGAEGGIVNCRPITTEDGSVVTTEVALAPFPEGFTGSPDIDRFNLNAWELSDESGEVVGIALVASLLRDDHVLGLVMVVDRPAFNVEDNEIASRLLNDLVAQAVESFPVEDE